MCPLPEAPGALPTLASVLDRLCIAPDQVRCVYLRGSRAVGYAGTRGDGTESDWDFVIVTAAREAPQVDVHVSHANLEAVLYDEASFRRLVEQCCVWALECVFAPRWAVLAEKTDFRARFAEHRAQSPREVLHAQLRASVSYEEGRRWSRARRALEQQGDPHGCRKSMFIALRFLSYGVELARTGAIADLSSANHLWDQLRADRSESWAELLRRFGPVRRALQDTLRREAPKVPRYGGARRWFEGQRAQRIADEASLSPVRSFDARESRDARDAEGPQLETVRRLRALDARDPMGAVAALAREFQLHVRQHARYPNVVQLRYTERSEPRDHPVVRECRGLVLDAARDFEVLAYPFDRFFNLGEPGCEHAIDWATARVYPKLDGSLAVLYWYDDAWHVASSRTPDARGLVGARGPEGPAPFATLFWSAFRARGYGLPPASDARRCFVFELTSRRHPILVRHEDERLTLLAARDLDTLRELDAGEIARERGWTAVAECALESLAGEGGEPLARRLEATARGLDGSLHEGFVVCDGAYRRAKVKSPDYVRMSWMFPLCAPKGGVRVRKILVVLLAGEADEFLAYCPEHRAAFDEVRARYDALCDAIDRAYEALRDEPDAKRFALGARAHRFSAALFARRRSGVSTAVALQRCPTERLERWLGLPDPSAATEQPRGGRP